MSFLVSIVIPHFNRSALLAECLASVQSQTATQWEVVVVDDGSSPAERAAIERLSGPEIRILDRSRDPKGHSTCRNIGIAESRGSHILFLDSDDQLAPWCIEQRLAALENGIDYDFQVFPVLLFRDSPGDTRLLWNDLNAGGDLERFLRSDPPWQTTSPLWKRSFLEKLQGFNEKLFYGADSELHIRALVGNARYEIRSDLSPDAFIRRNDNPRITNTLSPTILDARRTRLQEGSRLLGEENASSNCIHLWEGQYFQELEFLLFNANDRIPETWQIYRDWISHYKPGRVRRAVVRTYLTVGLRTRTRAYLALRIARRIAMLILPDAYFPQPGGFESTLLSEEKSRALLRQWNSVAVGKEEQ